MSEQPTIQPPIVVMQQGGEPNIAIRIIWFVFIGWWLSQLVILAGWFCNLTIIGLPLGLWLLNRIPQAATLKMAPPDLVARMDEASGLTVMATRSRQQRPFWQRALYFVFVGWWFSLLWLQVAWLLGIIIIGLPLSFWMFGAAGKVTTLKR